MAMQHGGDRAGTVSALTHRCWLRAGQGCPPLPRIPAASRAPLRSGRALPRERQFPSAVTAGARPGLRPPALTAPARSGWDGWDGSGWERGGRRRPGCGSGSGCQDAVTMGTRCRPGGEPFASPPPPAIPRQCPMLGERGATERPRKQQRSLRHGGRAVGTERGPCPRLPRWPTPASRQKVRC
ncbi:PREDICTED: uncharacterized protein LOC106851793 [Sturnus vulgaris]|uniref:uncharacterized protein LOC106851793 n=1 Tax=Sturnus vulgaris TaxID=9172 RepID=UPI00071A54AD|nr:PREDICTED: uncharacterized protein LOC106851793 [Sturnus vulgaris]